LVTQEGVKIYQLPLDGIHSTVLTRSGQLNFIIPLVLKASAQHLELKEFLEVQEEKLFVHFNN